MVSKNVCENLYKNKLIVKFSINVFVMNNKFLLMTNPRTPYTVIILARRQCYIYKKFFNIHCTVDACRDPPTKFNYEFEKYMSKNPSPLVKLLPLIRGWFYLFKILIDFLTGAKPVLLQIGASAREMKYCAGICIFLRTYMQLKRPNIHFE